MGTLKPRSDGSIYSNTVIGIAVVDGWHYNYFALSQGRMINGQSRVTLKT